MFGIRMDFAISEVEYAFTDASHEENNRFLRTRLCVLLLLLSLDTAHVLYSLTI